MLKAKYKTAKGEAIEIPLIEIDSGQFALETDDGKQRPFDATLSDDPAHGVLTFEDFIEDKPLSPQPNSPERSLALVELQQAIDRFRAADRSYGTWTRGNNVEKRDSNFE